MLADHCWLNCAIPELLLKTTGTTVNQVAFRTFLTKYDTAESPPYIYFSSSSKVATKFFNNEPCLSFQIRVDYILNRISGEIRSITVQSLNLFPITRNLAADYPLLRRAIFFFFTIPKVITPGHRNITTHYLVEKALGTSRQFDDLAPHENFTWNQMVVCPRGEQFTLFSLLGTIQPIMQPPVTTQQVKSMNPDVKLELEVVDDILNCLIICKNKNYLKKISLHIGLI